MGILQNFSRVSTTTCFHHLDFNEIRGEKSDMGTTHGCCMLFWTNPGSRTRQNNGCMATCLQSHKHLSKTSKTCWRIKNELLSDVLLWNPTYGHTSVGQQVKAYFCQLCARTGYRLLDFPREIGTDAVCVRENQCCRLTLATKMMIKCNWERFRFLCLMAYQPSWVI